RASDPGDALWDDAAVGATLERLSALARSQGIPFEPTSELLWSIANSQRHQDEVPVVDAVQPIVAELLGSALEAFSTMRAKEGAALLSDLLARTETLRRHLQVVAERAPGVVVNYRGQLLQRLRQAGLDLNLDDERVLKEIALFADRCDLSEEITRFRSHLDQ